MQEENEIGFQILVKSSKWDEPRVLSRMLSQDQGTFLGLEFGGGDKVTVCSLPGRKELNTAKPGSLRVPLPVGLALHLCPHHPHLRSGERGFPVLLSVLDQR